MILYTFIILFIVVALARAGLSFFNLRYNLRYARSVPLGFEELLSNDELHKSTAYLKSSTYFSQINLLFDKTFLLIFLFSGLFVWVVDYASLYNSVLSGLVFFWILMGAFFVIELPFSYYSTFVLEHKFGFNTSDISTWIKDKIKELLLGFILISILLLGIVLLVVFLPKIWWILSWLFVMIFSLVTMIIYPTVLVPLFNKLSPLEGPLAEKIVDLAEKAGIKVKSIFVMDASKRTKHSNAFFAGLGSTKRIILYDTLVNSNTDDELLTILAHEMGHWKHKHILKMMISSQSLMLIGFYLAWFFLNYEPMYSAFGLHGTPYYAGLFLIAVFADIPGFFISPITNFFSRKYEREADDFAIKLTGNKEAFTNALKKLSKENLANLFPHPFYVIWNYSHPPIVERIETVNSAQ